MYGKNKLPKYAAKERFELCLKICEEYFSSWQFWNNLLK
jgi:hypothetical protein